MTWIEATRILALCVLLAGAETLHGIFRTVVVVPRIGKERAQKLSIFTGSLLAVGLCAWQVPGIGLQGAGAHLALGVVLAAFMAAFDVILGHAVLRRPWRVALRDLDSRTGNRLLYGLIVLALAPFVLWLTGLV